MEELIGRLVANVGVDRAAAEKAVGIILQFLLKEGPAGKTQALVDNMPGAAAAIAAASPDSSSGGIGFPRRAQASRRIARSTSDCASAVVNTTLEKCWR